MNEFLQKEYEEAFNQLRYYDDRHDYYNRLVITISTSVATIVAAIFKIFESNTPQTLPLLAALFLIVYVSLLLIHTAMVQNRVYFVYMARQINAIRSFSLDNYASDFTNNQLYRSTDNPFFKLLSTQTLNIFGISFISSCYAGAFLFSILNYSKFSNAFVWSIISAIALIIIQFILTWRYLANKEDKTADQAVHNSE